MAGSPTTARFRSRVIGAAGLLSLAAVVAGCAPHAALEVENATDTPLLITGRFGGLRPDGAVCFALAPGVTLKREVWGRAWVPLDMYSGDGPLRIVVEPAGPEAFGEFNYLVVMPNPGPYRLRVSGSKPDLSFARIPPANGAQPADDRISVTPGALIIARR
jgi:hypothetical protein